MEPLDRDSAKKLYNRYRSRRDGIRNSPEMASICLVCGSAHIVPKTGDAHKLALKKQLTADETKA